MTSSSDSKESQFKQHFAEVLRDLQAEGIKDGAALGLIGSLATDLALKLGQTTWSGAKSVMGPAQYDELLTSFQQRGNDLQKSGKTKQAYAIQALAVSLVAASQRKDPQMAEGEQLIDAIIDRTVALTLQAGKARSN